MSGVAVTFLIDLSLIVTKVRNPVVGLLFDLSSSPFSTLMAAMEWWSTFRIDGSRENSSGRSGREDGRCEVAIIDVEFSGDTLTDTFRFC
jgi:hypothetical protein